MELWIRSQDKEMLAKTNRLDIDTDGKTIVINGFETVIGKYKTKERALEILNQIQERIINLQLVQLEERGKARKDVYTTPYLECVYEMPKE